MTNHTFTQGEPTHEWDARQQIGRKMTLGSSGLLDGANFVIRKKERAGDVYEPLSNGNLAANQPFEHTLEITSPFYQIECLNPTGNTDSLVNVNLTRETERGGNQDTP